MVATALCSKCGTNPRANEDSTNPWCQPCKTRYQKEWALMRKEMLESRSYAAGFESARMLFAAKFRQLGSVQISAAAAAEWVRTEPFPRSREA